MKPISCVPCSDIARILLHVVQNHIQLGVNPVSLTHSHTSRSPGFGLTLVAETLNGAFLCAESASNEKGSADGPTVPEDLGRDTAKLLLEEIYRVS